MYINEKLEGENRKIMNELKANQLLSCHVSMWEKKSEENFMNEFSEQQMRRLWKRNDENEKIALLRLSCCRTLLTEENSTL